MWLKGLVCLGWALFWWGVTEKRACVSENVVEEGMAREQGYAHIQVCTQVKARLFEPWHNVRKVASTLFARVVRRPLVSR